MSQVIVGRWGKNLAVRVPLEVARATGLTDGEHVEIEARDGDIVIRRASAQARRDADLAIAEIIDDSRGRSLNGVTIRELVDEGRRG